MKSGQLGDPSSHWTIAAADQAFVIGVGLLTLFHFWLSAYLPPAEDELYYWTWAQTLHGSYFDHPPLVAYFIAVSTAIFGKSLFGIRFFSCITTAIILLALKSIARRTQLLTLLIFTPMCLVGSVLMTPDTPLLLFWTLYLLWVIGVNRPLDRWSHDPVSRAYHKSPISWGYWALGGMLLGLGFLGKYSMLLAVPCSFLALFTRHRKQSWLPGYCFHLLVALVVVSPVLIFNIEQHFVSFHFQFANALAGRGFSIGRLFEFAGSQIFLLGALPFLLLPWVLLTRSELADENELHVCYFFFVIPFLFFLFQSFRTKLEANWALVCYLSFWPLAQRLIDRSSFKTFGRVVLFGSFAVPLVVSGALLIHLFTPFKFIAPRRDRLTRLSQELSLSRQIAADLKNESAGYFFPTYQWTAYLRYAGLAAEQLYPPGRQSQFTLQPADPCQHPTIFYLADTPEPNEVRERLSCFKHHSMVRPYPLVVRGETVDTYYLIRYSK